MSIQAVMFVLDCVFKDPRLVSEYVSAPDETLSRFELSDEEREAIVSGNREQLIAIGVDERVAGWVLRPPNPKK